MKPLMHIKSIDVTDNKITISAKKSVSFNVKAKVKDTIVSDDARYAIIILDDNTIYINSQPRRVDEILYGPKILTTSRYACIVYVAKLHGKRVFVVNNDFALDIEDWWRDNEFEFSRDGGYILFKKPKRNGKISIEYLLNEVPKHSKKLVQFDHKKKVASEN